MAVKISFLSKKYAVYVLLNLAFLNYADFCIIDSLNNFLYLILNMENVLVSVKMSWCHSVRLSQFLNDLIGQRSNVSGKMRTNRTLAQIFYCELNK